LPSCHRENVTTYRWVGWLLLALSQDAPLLADLLQLGHDVRIPHGANKEQEESSVGEDDCEHNTHSGQASYVLVRTV